MNLYQVDLTMYGTLYVRAKSKKEAMMLIGSQDGCLELPVGEISPGSIEVSGLQFNDPGLPIVSISPVITLALTEIDEMDIEKWTD